MLKIASLACALVVGTGVALAAPANADADTDEYLQWLGQQGISYTSEQHAIDYGYVQCSMWRNGQFDSSPQNQAQVFTIPSPLHAALMDWDINFALCPDTAQAYWDWVLDDDPEWNLEDPNRAQEELDRRCSNEPQDAACKPYPDSVLNRLGQRDSPAARLRFGQLCAWGDDTEPPCA